MAFLPSSVDKTYLPQDIYSIIIRFLPGKDLYKSKRINKIFLKIINNYIESLIPDCFKFLIKNEEWRDKVLNHQYIRFQCSFLHISLNEDHALRIYHQEKMKDKLEDMTISTEFIYVGQSLKSHKRLSMCACEGKKNAMDSLSSVIESLKNQILLCRHPLL